MIIYIAILIAGIVGFFIHLMVSKKPKTPLRIVELFLLYQLVFSVGFSSLLAFFGLTFLSEFVAKYTGWPVCPFQEQLGNVNLGYAVLGFLSIWYREDFWTATIIGMSIWLIGDGIHHLYHMFYYDNYTLGNIGVPLYTDFIVPIEMLILLAIYKYLKKQQQKENKISTPL